MAYLKVVNENGTKRLIDYSKAPQYNKLAVNEPTTTASQSYTKGEYLTQGGYFKKVTSAIASGDTISSSNTEDTTVGEELTEINNDLSTTIQYSEDVYVNGKVCTVFLHGDKTSYSIPTPAINRYMATRTINNDNGLFGDAHMSYIGNVTFSGQTGNNVTGVITFMIA